MSLDYIRKWTQSLALRHFLINFMTSLVVISCILVKERNVLMYLCCSSITWVWSSFSRWVAGGVYITKICQWIFEELIWIRFNLIANLKAFFVVVVDSYSFTCNSSSTLVSGDPGCCLTMNLTNKKNNSEHLCWILQQKKGEIKILGKIRYL